MNFNTILLRFGLDPDCFINEDRDPIRTKDGYIYEVRQRTDIRVCPRCGSISGYINDHDIVEINCQETDQIKDTLRIIKTRFKCRDCGLTYTPSIKGINPKSQISNQTKTFIINDFTKIESFITFAKRYGLTVNRVIHLFDENIRHIPRGKLPAVLCIDEIHFDGTNEGPYCCVLYDHEKREVINIIESRQLPYLDEYFSSIPESERYNVKFFVSDMYDGYRTICHKYFKYALHIVDLFHVVKLSTEAVNKIRYNHVKDLEETSPLITFMKTHWRLYICKAENIPDKWYTPKGYGYSIHYTDMVFDGIKMYSDLLEGYNIFQDLYHYNRNDTFTESLKFMDHISDQLMNAENPILQKVGKSYRKWRIEIADGLAKNQTGRYYSNGIAEAINNNLKTIIKVSYGYQNFKRFRKRVLLN